MEEKILDIKDFQPYSSVSDSDKVLMAKGGTGTDASITIGLLRTILTDRIKPEIKDGIWYIGGVSTGVSAGIVQMRLGDNGIEYRYSDNDEWAMLITVSRLQEPAVNIAEELRTHPCKVSENYTWMIWDAVNKAYIDTGISARGRSPIIRDMIWWVWDDLTGDYISTGQAVNDSFVLTKEEVEGVFVGNVVGHHHLEYTVPTIDSTPTDATLTWTDSDNNLYMFFVGQLCRVPDTISEKGYKFYQLYDIKDGKAVWGEISGSGNGVGRSNPTYPGAEYFNDYENNKAEGVYAHAEGRETTATGPRAHAEGYKTSVYAADAHAEGRETWAMASQAHVEGIYTIGIGPSSHVEGSTEADWDVGEESSVILNDVEKIRDFLANFTTQAYPYGEDGSYYFQIDAEKLGNYIFHGALGVSTHAEGINNIVCDKAGHVEGYNNVAGDMIPGHGQDSVAYAQHVEGMHNKSASLLQAIHLGGAYCRAESGHYTFGHGYGILLKNDYEVSFGRWNSSEVDGKKVLFSFGIGTSDTGRKNAISVFEDGSVSIPELSGLPQDVSEQIAQLQNNLNKAIDTFNNKINSILNSLSTTDLSKKVFVVSDSLVITNKIVSEVSEDTLTINDNGFTFNEGYLIYEETSENTYLTGAYSENGNLVFTDSSEEIITNN